MIRQGEQKIDIYGNMHELIQGLLTFSLQFVSFSWLTSAVEVWQVFIFLVQMCPAGVVVCFGVSCHNVSHVVMSESD